MTDPERWADTAGRNMEHACKLILRLLRAQGCDDAEAYLADALLDAAQQWVPVETIRLCPASDPRPQHGEWGEDLLD